MNRRMINTETAPKITCVNTDVEDRHTHVEIHAVSEESHDAVLCGVRTSANIVE